jgi:hypothetical protein
MKTKNIITKSLIATFLLLLVISVMATYYNTIVLRDFVIINDLEEETI